ncbi:tetratricopeptide repeat-containing sensor histidine kinase [Flavisolibacter nicotianae]|uniref:tetratricopeptide repeat-containing sensor histidine kinase n=1 Tax=Flavisolibacter nicotianae TaxID=2364882 RepID=UPI0013C51DBF|nr:tetratricopeptide repeat-containing sensor histidine kinase [Flavisolibacter nicotianae]
MQILFFFIVALCAALCSTAQKPGQPVGQVHTAAVVKHAAHWPAETLTLQLEQLEKKLAVFRRQHATDSLLPGLFRYANLCEQKMQPQATMLASRELLSLARETKQPFYESVASVFLGRWLAGRNQFDSAMYFQYRALQLGESLRNDSLLAVALGSLGSLYNFRKDYPKSLSFFERALQHAENVRGAERLQLVCMGNKALALSWLQQYENAVALQVKALPLVEKLGNDYNSTPIKMNLASNYVSLHRYGRARACLDELVVQLSTATVPASYAAQNLAIIGMIYWDMRENKKAKQLLHRQATVAQKLNTNFLLQRIYDTLGVIAQAEQQYREALACKKTAQRYRVLLNKEANGQLASEMEVKYKTAEKEKALSLQRLSLLQKDLQVQKGRHSLYYMLAASVVVLLLAFLLFIRTRHKKTAHQKELQSLQQEKEIQLLQALMQGEEKERSRIAKDLHDGVAGMLAAVKMHLSSSVAYEDAAYRKAVSLLDEVTADVRKTSHNLMPDVLLQHGLNIALYRYCNNISRASLPVLYEFAGREQRFPEGFELSVYRLVQELLHTFLRYSTATEATVQMCLQARLLCITVEDKSTGFAARSDQSNGIGLDSLEQRIRALNGSLVFGETGSGVSAQLSFNVEGLAVTGDSQPIQAN